MTITIEYLGTDDSSVEEIDVLETNESLEGLTIETVLWSDGSVTHRTLGLDAFDRCL